MIIDTLNKTVELNGESLGEVVKQLQAMLPEAWEDYKLTPHTITVKEYVRDYSPQPYIIPAPIYPYPLNPLEPYITYGTGDPLFPYRGTTSDYVITPCVNNSGYQA